MIITGLLDNTIRLLRRLGIDPNKFDINCNPVLLYYKNQHGKQYAFLTDQYCKICIYHCNWFKSNINDIDIGTQLNDFTFHVLSNHSHSL